MNPKNFPLAIFMAAASDNGGGSGCAPLSAQGEQFKQAFLARPPGAALRPTPGGPEDWAPKGRGLTSAIQHIDEAGFTKVDAKAVQGDDFELPSEGAQGAACGLGDGATCEACQ